MSSRVFLQQFLYFYPRYRGIYGETLQLYNTWHRQTMSYWYTFAMYAVHIPARCCLIEFQTRSIGGLLCIYFRTWQNFFEKIPQISRSSYTNVRLFLLCRNLFEIYPSAAYFTRTFGCNRIFLTEFFFPYKFECTLLVSCLAKIYSHCMIFTNGILHIEITIGVVTVAVIREIIWILVGTFCWTIHYVCRVKIWDKTIAFSSLKHI